MAFFSNFREDWFGNIRADILAGIVVALALIPEAIGFSIIAGVDPAVGLWNQGEGNDDAGKNRLPLPS